MRKFEPLLFSALLASAGCVTQRPAVAPMPAPAPASALVAAEPAPKPTRRVARSASFRDREPAPLPGTARLHSPVPVKEMLKNGLTVLVYENHALPLVSVELALRAGVNADPEGKPGLAHFVVKMLDEGTRQHGAARLATAMEGAATEVTSLNVGPAETTVRLDALKETFPEVLALLAEMVQRPAFRPVAVKRLKARIIGGLLERNATSRALAEDAMKRALFGARHPWGQPSGGTIAAVKSFTRADLLRFWRTWYRPGNAVLSVAGDVEPKALLKRIDRAFGQWKPRAVPKVKRAAFPNARHDVILVPVARARQSQVWMGTRLDGISETSPDAIPLELANGVLGGTASSRFNMDLREKHGYSYGVYSHLVFEPGAATWIARGGIQAGDTARAVAEYEKLLARFADGDVTERELSDMKSDFVHDLPGRMQTDDSVAKLMAELWLHHLPLDYYRTYADRIRAVTRADVERVVKRYFHPEDWAIVVAGPAKDEAALQRMSHVEHSTNGALGGQATSARGEKKHPVR